MLYLTGDTHGDVSRLKSFKRLFRHKKRDYVCICGDFGVVWDGGAAEQKSLHFLEGLDCDVLFLEGTHDNLDRLEGYPTVEYHGGQAGQLGKNIFWLRRGEIYTLDDLSVLAIGGGESEDADEREPGVSWWSGEMPTPEELSAIREKLAARQNTVDIILTHSHPRIDLGAISHGEAHLNHLTAFLGELLHTLTYRHWYFGGSHLDRQISPKITAVFEKVIPVSEE